MANPLRTFALVPLLPISVGLYCWPAKAQPTEPVPTLTGPASLLENAECVPQCRSGYFCHKGQCASECNPLCASNERCSNRECVPTAPAAPALPVVQWPAAIQSYPTVPVSDPHSATGTRNHDGFYLRMGLGLGAISGTLVYDGYSFAHSLMGFAGHFELAFGGTPAQGLVIGGGLFGAMASAPFYGWSELGQDYRVPGGPIAVEVLGPFVDFYPYPSSGLHFQFALGPAGVAIAKGDPQRLCYGGNGCVYESVPGTSYSGASLGVVSGVGYEAFVASQWSLGALLRVIYTAGKVSPDDSASRDLSISTLSPGLLFVATYH